MARDGAKLVRTKLALARNADRHVGARIRQRRIMMGLPQQQLADLIGVTCQQAHKYETGVNRISVGRLYELAQALDVDVAYFLDLPDDEPNLQDRAMMGFARSFTAILNPLHREALEALVRTMAAGNVRNGDGSRRRRLRRDAAPAPIRVRNGTDIDLDEGWPRGSTTPPRAVPSSVRGASLRGLARTSRYAGTEAHLTAEVIANHTGQWCGVAAAR